MSQQLPDGFMARPATTEDATCVATLWNDRSEATRDERPSTPERVLNTWDHPKFNLSTDSRLVFAPDGALIGYAHVRDVKDPPVDVFAGYSVRPDHDHTEWLWDDLFAWLDNEARRVIPKAPEDARIALVAGAPAEDTTAQRELTRHRFEYDRTFHRMTTSFEEPAAPVALPDGMAIRTFKPGADDVALVTAYLDAFADHYGIIHQPFETELAEWRQLMQKDGFDPSLWFLATDATSGGEIAGLCICHAAAPGDPERGSINDLGVRPAWRRRGVGQALLRHAFSEFASRGIQGATLTVDSENRTGAPALYERVGMRSVQVSHTHVKELRPGVNLVPQ
jgi:mycothiol synthase